MKGSPTIAATRGCAQRSVLSFNAVVAETRLLFGFNAVIADNYSQLWSCCLGISRSRPGVSQGSKHLYLGLAFPRMLPAEHFVRRLPANHRMAAPCCVLRATPAALSLGWLASESASSLELTSSSSSSLAKSSNSLPPRALLASSTP